MALTKEDLQAISALMKAELEPINERLDNMESMQSKLSADVAELNHFIKPAFKTIQEGIEGLQERNRQLDLVTSKVEDHDHRLFAIEEKLKKAE